MKRDCIRIRNRVLTEIHNFFQEREFIYLDTKRLVDFPGVEPNIKLFSINDKFLIPSPEIEIKKIISEYNIPKAYDIGHVFRKDEKTDEHSEEFTMLEWYRQKRELDSLKKDIFNLILYLAEKIDLKLTVPPPPWKEISLFNLYKELFGFDITDETSLKENFIKITNRKEDLTSDEMFYILYIEFAESKLPEKDPFFLIDFPYYIPSLAREKTENGLLTDRFEFYFNGYEIANAYRELTGRKNYEKRFALLNKINREKNRPIITPSKDFLELIDKFPASSGIALGVDRLIMIFCNTPHITDVIY